jgi:hypothetical protein
MVRRRPTRLASATSIMAAMVVGVAALTGCATRSAAGPAQAGGETPPIPQALGVSVPGLSWAIVRTGGPSVGGLFWQLLVQDRPGGPWRLATPPGVADNGGLAVTRATDGTMTAGFVPSQLLRFSPLAVTGDAGAHWSQGLLPAGLIAGPDSLAAVPGGRLVAVTSKSVEESAAGATGWRSLVTRGALAGTAAGRRCGLTSLTGAVAEPDGRIVVAGGCARAGAIGLFAATATGWQLAGPALPSSVGLRSASVAGLISTKAGTAALIAGQTRRGEMLIPVWLAARSTSWSTYFPMTFPVSAVTSIAASAQGTWAAVVNGGRALIAQSPGVSVSNPALANPVSLPAPGATLVTGAAGGSLTALVPGVDTVAIWRRTASGVWRRSQLINVPSTPGGQSH